MALACALVVFQGGYYAGAVCVIGAVSTAAFAVLAGFRKARASCSPIGAVLLAIAALYLVSSVAHGATLTMLQETATWFALAGMSLWCAFDSERDKRRTLDALGAAGAVLAAAGILMFAGLLPLEGSVSAGRLMFTFQYANVAGMFFAIIAVTCLGSANKRLRIASVLPIVALLLTQSVGAIAVFFVALALRTIRMVKGGENGAKWGMAALVAVAMACAALAVLAPGRVMQATQTFTERLIQAADALALLAQNAALGIGPDQWQFAYPLVQTAQYRATDVHCSYLQVALDAGVLTMVLLAAALVAGAVARFRRGDGACGLCLAMIAVHALFDFDFQFGAVVFLAALMASGSAPADTARETTSRLPVPVGVRVALLWCTVACALVFSCYGVHLDMRAGAAQAAAARVDTEAVRAELDASPALAGDPSMQACLAQACFDAGDYRGAVEASEGSGMESATVDFQRVISYVQLGETDGALATMQDMLHKRPYDAELYEAARQLVVEAGLGSGFTKAFNAEAARANELAVCGHAAWLHNQETVELIADVDGRGAIVSSDGAVLAESATSDTPAGSGGRTYQFGADASPVVGSCYTQGAPDGIEQLYADELAAGNDVQLTVDSRIQAAAVAALGDLTGAVVVIDPFTGATLAMASTPAYDPSADQAADDEELANRAAELHIPGSTFKTVTLAAALERGVVTLDTLFPAPAEIAFEGGSVSNYDMIQYPDQTLAQAYAKSINTVFAQLAIEVGFDDIATMAESFGFEADIMPDFAIRTSTICDADAMGALMQAWSGVGQALYQFDGSLQGPIMSPVQGAAIAASIANGGYAVRPYIVQAIGGNPTPAVSAGREPSRAFLSQETVEQIGRAMHSVVAEGTGRSAAVEGVDVAGKTGTAETANGVDDGWFIGFAERDGQTYAFAVLVEGGQSTDAAAVASRVIQALF